MFFRIFREQKYGRFKKKIVFILFSRYFARFSYVSRQKKQWRVDLHCWIFNANHAKRTRKDAKSFVFGFVIIINQDSAAAAYSLFRNNLFSHSSGTSSSCLWTCKPIPFDSRPGACRKSCRFCRLCRNRDKCQP